MAYKQNPGRGNQPKTGRGIPAPFKQTMGAVGAGAGTETGKYITKKVKQAGEAVSSANEAGKKSYDKSIKGDSYWGGTGRKDTYTKNPVEYVKGFVSDLASDKNTKTNQKKKSPVKQMETLKKVGNKIKEGAQWLSDAAEGRHGSASYSGGDESMRQKNIARNNPKTEEVKKEVKKPATKTIKKASPVKQMETIKKVYNKGKEIVSKVGDKISKANDAGQESYDKSIKGDTFWGGSGAKRSYTKNPVEYVKGFVKDVVSGDNPKTKEKKKSPAKQLGRQAVAKMCGKKAPAKMKKC